MRNKGLVKIDTDVLCIDSTSIKVHPDAAGNRNDVPEGRKLIGTICFEDNHFLLMDRAYEDDKPRAFATKQGFIPVILPKKKRREPWDYDRELYKCRNEVERYF